MKKRIALSLLFALELASSSVFAQSWTPVKNVPNIGANAPLLLTDGSVMVQDADNNDWWKLTPDQFGNYFDGSWKQLASTPNWGPLYFASQVLADGRVFAMGGEYNFGNSVWTNQGGVYDPVADKWTTISAPSQWPQMGDAASVTLPNGKVFVADPLSSGTGIFDPQTNLMTAPYGGSSLEYNDEAGLTLLPNGKVYMPDCWTAQVSQQFDPATMVWSHLPTMPYNVVDLPNAEIGPALVQYNGLMIQFGGNGANIQFDSTTNTWINTPSFPKLSVGQIDCADAPAVLLPNGNVMVDAGPGYGGPGCYFYLWNGTALTAMTGPPDSAGSVDFLGNFLLLPNGQVLFTDQSQDVELYTPGGAPDPAWAPRISSVPTQLKVGSSYVLSGTQLNGLSGGSAYGDDEENETNYPIVKLTFAGTGHVFYCREYNPSTMAICTGANTIVSTHFTVPKGAELGRATLQVVTNGIPSNGVPVTVLPPLVPYAVSLYPGQGTSPVGSVADIFTLDGTYFSGSAVSTPSGEVCAVEADFAAGSGITFIKALATCKANNTAPGVPVTQQLFIYNWATKSFVLVGSGTLNGPAESTISGSPTVSAAQFVGPRGEVRVVVRGLVPTHVSNSAFRFSVDFVGLQFG